MNGSFLAVLPVIGLVALVLYFAVSGVKRPGGRGNAFPAVLFSDSSSSLGGRGGGGGGDGGGAAGGDGGGGC